MANSKESVNAVIEKRHGPRNNGTATLGIDELILTQKGDISRKLKETRIFYEDIDTVEWKDKGMLSPAKIKIRTRSRKKFSIEKNKDDKLKTFYNALRQRMRESRH